jgi:hypothetical protein
MAIIPIADIGMLKIKRGKPCARAHSPEKRTIPLTPRPTRVSGMPTMNNRAEYNRRFVIEAI